MAPAPRIPHRKDRERGGRPGEGIVGGGDDHSDTTRGDEGDDDDEEEEEEDVMVRWNMNKERIESTRGRP
jgi:hypothetical protein